MTPDQYCQEKAARSGSSFYYAFLFLPAQQRRAITAVYAFCREVDDVVDECTDPSVARIKLAWWSKEINSLFEGRAEHPVAQALQPHLSPFGLREEQFQAIIDGMQMDLDQTRYMDWPGLRKYCWHVAGVVGQLSAQIFTYQNSDTLAYAEKLGLALQMTNIIRDVGDDARRGRIYLPIDDLQKNNVKAADILNNKESDDFRKLMAFQTARARQLYQEAAELLHEQDRRAQRPGLMMAAIYYTLLCEIEKDGWPVLTSRISLTPLRKLMIAWKIWVGGGKGFIRKMRKLDVAQG
ncbi:farnesyl-diphosphate farnesyltransferase [Advenella incenata]|jgi:phytoene synthase|uniref:Farnesyl-diphosphate farnesyltransferase n=1 Tax=Advenella incenata TaxID=267800 RepID=A0A4Q7VCN2_9BURK|nr:presqualene diphosphate synthase HpnD [Advenella incenata]RZT93093.1 farnesyl-diphosphate farnesyltransferase [Advenella incenata]